VFKIGKNVKIHETARIDVRDGSLGDRCIIGPNVVIEGRRVAIGHEAWIDDSAYIGGGSCRDPASVLEVGDFLHMGRFSHLNQGRGLIIGHEFGCGMNTKVFTHGAYQSAWDGFPVQWGAVHIGNRVWLPNAWVNPNVKIGNDVVVAALSLVNRDLPDGCLAGGIPCRVIQERVYPRTLDAEEKRRLFERIFSEAVAIELEDSSLSSERFVFDVINEDVYSVGSTVFDIAEKKIEGEATAFTETLKNQLRRYGIRFRYKSDSGTYKSW
jgi:acetyltransferase-like isoleucine patch superfamily enzyme